MYAVCFCILAREVSSCAPPLGGAVVRERGEARSIAWRRAAPVRCICLLYTSPSPRDAHES
eukprot:1203076-Prymnesium_polylepis.1